MIFLRSKISNFSNLERSRRPVDAHDQTKSSHEPSVSGMQSSNTDKMSRRSRSESHLTPTIIYDSYNLKMKLTSYKNKNLWWLYRPAMCRVIEQVRLVVVASVAESSNARIIRVNSIVTIFPRTNAEPIRYFDISTWFRMLSLICDWFLRLQKNKNKKKTRRRVNAKNANEYVRCQDQKDANTSARLARVIRAHVPSVHS